MRFCYRTDLWVEAEVFINKARLSDIACYSLLKGKSYDSFDLSHKGLTDQMEAL